MEVRPAWLRSTNNNNFYNAQYLKADGGNNNTTVDQSYLVRPALHSLTKDVGDFPVSDEYIDRRTEVK